MAHNSHRAALALQLHRLTVPTLSVVIDSTIVKSKYEVHRIYCIGRNYREHAIEMGHDPDREPPFFFQKPADAAIDTTVVKSIPYPSMTDDLHHEAELVVALKGGGINLTPEDAKESIFGYALGCDLTRRDLQSEAKYLRRPWDHSKGFDFSAPCGAIVPKEECSLDLKTLQLDMSCCVNGETRQQSKLNCMIWNIEETISILSKYYRLTAGDLILTGTPAGVSPLQIGDSVRVSCGDIPECTFQVSES
uniref:Fumarylacetoacetase-like C-terminal domain-containing protein n=1 Tax=Leptocylindrus danicus TaxID=163516 RepID=A0A7S2NY14_9STRA